MFEVLSYENSSSKIHDLDLETVIRHRNLEQVEEQRLDIKSLKLKDGFDVKGVLYLCYYDNAYGIIGSARLLPREYLPQSMFSLFPSTITKGYFLVDCNFYISDKSGFYKNPDHVIETQYEYLFEAFYESVNIYIENLILREPLAKVYFYLNEEELEALQEVGDCNYCISEKLITPADELDLFVGIVEMSDLDKNYKRILLN